MPEITVWEPEDPRKIYKDLIKRCKNAREWCIACLVDESWVAHDRFPIEHFIADGVYYFRVIAMTHKEALLKVVDSVPVIKILDLDKNE
jgi:hypothetical protein